MEKEKNLLDQYEALPVIHASDEWKNHLWQRMEKNTRKTGPKKPPGMYLLAGCMLGLLNLFVLTRGPQHRPAPQNTELSAVAHEFLMPSSSSNY